MVKKGEGLLKDHIQVFGLADSVTVMTSSKIGNTEGKEKEGLINSAELERASEEQERIISIAFALVILERSGM